MPTFNSAMLIYCPVVAWLLFSSFFAGSLTLENPLILLCATTAILLLPGRLISTYFFPGNMLWFERLSIDLFISLGFCFCSAWIAISLNQSIHLSLFVFSALITGTLLWRIQRTELSISQLRFNSDPIVAFAWINNAPTLIILFLSILMYWKGGNLADVSDEVALQLAYARMYAEGGVLAPESIGVSPNEHLYFVVLLWEFAIAMICVAGRLDPTWVYIKFRCLLPIFALGSFSVILRLLNLPSSKRALITIFALVIAFGRMVCPDETLWKYLTDRMGASFFSSIHHSDVAMDIILPLLLFFLINYLRKGGWALWGLLCASILVTLSIHIREYFHSALLVPIFLISWSIVWPAKFSTQILRFLSTIAAYLICVGAFFFLISANVEPTGANEFGKEKNEKATILSHIKEHALEDLFLFRPLTRQNGHTLAQDEESQHYHGAVFIFFVLACIPLLVHKSPRIRFFSIYSLLSMALLFSWEFSRHILGYLTYSELFLGILRYFYINIYIAVSLFVYNISSNLLTIFQRAKKNSSPSVHPVIAALAASLSFGFLLCHLFLEIRHMQPLEEYIAGYLPYAGYLFLFALYFKSLFRTKYLLSNRSMLLSYSISATIMLFLFSVTAIRSANHPSYNIVSAENNQISVAQSIFPEGLLIALIFALLSLTIVQRIDPNRLRGLFINQKLLPSISQGNILILGLCFIFAFLLPGHVATTKWIVNPSPAPAIQLRESFSINPVFSQWLKSVPEPKSVFMIEPKSRYYPSLVAPVFTVPVPVSTVGIGEPFRKSQEAGNHYLYPSPKATFEDLSQHVINLEKLIEEIRKYKSDYLVISEQWKSSIGAPLLQFPNAFKKEIDIDNGPLIIRIGIIP